MKQVCKVFFLTTLGFKKSNDSVLWFLHDVRRDDQAVPDAHVLKDKRGKTSNNNKYDHDAVKRHIESYGPARPHYCREHAPNRRYLPSDITVKDMFDAHVKSNEQNNIFKTMNISMPKSFIIIFLLILMV